MGDITFQCHVEETTQIPTEGTDLCGLSLLFLAKASGRAQLHVNLRICSSCVSNTFCLGKS